jgi:hypothetical protein
VRRKQHRHEWFPFSYADDGSAIIDRCDCGMYQLTTRAGMVPSSVHTRLERLEQEVRRLAAAQEGEARG